MAARTSSDWWPTTTKIRSGGASARAVRSTCSIRYLPPARCSTLALRDFMRVPSPAARTTTVNGMSPLFPRWLLRLRRRPSLRQPHGYRGGCLRVMAHFLASCASLPAITLSPNFEIRRYRFRPAAPARGRNASWRPSGSAGCSPSAQSSSLPRGMRSMARMWSEAVKLGSFAGLPHQVDEIRFQRGRRADGRRHALHQQVWNHAGEKRTRSERDQVGLGDCAQGASASGRTLRRQQPHAYGWAGGCWLMLVSPLTRVPSARVASSATLAAVAG